MYLQRCGDPQCPNKAIVEHLEAEVRRLQPPIVVESKQRDWRIGLTVKTKERGHKHYYERGAVVDVLPDGTAGITCADGVLVLKLSGGSVVMERASDWVTA